MFIEYPEFTRLEDVKDTGLPGSRRYPAFLTATELTVAAGSTVGIPSQELENETDLVTFIKAVLVRTTRGADTFIHIQPTNGPSWMSALLPVWTAMPANGVFGPTDTYVLWALPEAYPLPPRSSVAVSIRNAHASTSAIVAFSLIGYSETMPAYKMPRKIPAAIGTRITSLASGSSVLAPETDLYPGFDMALDGLMIRGHASYSEVADDSILMRMRLKGHPRTLEAKVRASALRDLYTLLIPMHGAMLRAGEGLQVEIENEGGSTVDTIDVVAIGSRKVA